MHPTIDTSGKPIRTTLLLLFLMRGGSGVVGGEGGR